MSKARPVARTTGLMESKNIVQEMDGVRHAIESGVVDAQTITVLKRLLVQKSAPTASIPKVKSTTLTSMRSRTPAKTKQTPSTFSIEQTFPSNVLVSGLKSIVMASLTTLSTEAETRAKGSQTADLPAASKANIPIPQGIRNVITCCKLAVEALRQWQDNQDIGSTWVNKAYLGYINKLTALEMVNYVSWSLLI
jgi:hypothetical protein